LVDETSLELYTNNAQFNRILFFSVQQDSILVKYGGLDFASIEDKFYESKVLSFPHPKFSMKTQKFDIALLKLLTPVEYQFNVLPICLPDKDMIFDEEQSIVAGWGKLAEKGLVTTKLQYVGIPIINNTECQTIYKRINKLIDQDLMCAGYDIGQKDSCEVSTFTCLIFLTSYLIVLNVFP